MKESPTRTRSTEFVVRGATRRLPGGRDVGEAQVFGLLVGRSPEMRYVFRMLREVAATNLSLLVRGETGTGKELAVASDSNITEIARRSGLSRQYVRAYLRKHGLS